ncbi:MAG: DUF4230 domain-containing protein [Caldilineaceae bacterium]|nr:DUF4230 domain-containing protein [Caldilineaceae bacterium]
MTDQKISNPYALVDPTERGRTNRSDLAPASPPPTTAGTPRRSALDSILRFFGFSIAGALILIALVVLAGLWFMRDTATNLLTRSSETTVINGEAIVESIRQANKQILVEHYNVVDIDYTEAPAGWLGLLPIQQNFVLLLKGRVPAGFDLATLGADDIWISADGRRVQLVLPPPVIFTENIALDLENSRLLGQGDTCPDLICRDQLTAMQEDLLPQGRRLLTEASLRSGILNQVASDGQRYYEQFLRALGFAEVRVVVSGESLSDD